MRFQTHRAQILSVALLICLSLNGLSVTAAGNITDLPVSYYESHRDEWVLDGAKLIWAEARGVDSKDQQAAVLWCAYNRVFDDRWSDNLADVIREPGQFASIRGVHPDDDLIALSEDVFERFIAEAEGDDEVGRTLPNDYFFFAGDGKNNHFRKEYESTERWDWSLPVVYDGEGKNG